MWACNYYSGRNKPNEHLNLNGPECDDDYPVCDCCGEIAEDGEYTCLACVEEHCSLMEGEE